MDEFTEYLVFMHVADGMNYLVDTLRPIPVSLLKKWLQSTNALEDLTPSQIAMRVFHAEVVEAFIKASEYVRTDIDAKIKNN